MLKFYNRLLCFLLKPVLDDIERQNSTFYHYLDQRDKSQHELTVEVYTLRRELDLMKKAQVSTSA